VQKRSFQVIAFLYLSFLDYYLGYHQIPFNEEDQIKTSFITPFGIFCYTTAIYQRGIQRRLHSQLGCNTEAYVDNVVIKIFSVPLGKLLGYMVSHRSIDPNSEKVSAITKMRPPESLHDVQKLTGCMSALRRFISRLAIRGLPFFKILKKQDKFQWT
jgi:hypothetical protein